jgi:pimeloyl-ACP methyl ester carboxylesterase
MPRIRFAVDQTVRLEINGSTQRVRTCATRPGLPPLLVVQAGPGLPLLHEAGKFQQRLRFEEHFQVFYWEQRGCGPAPRADAARVSLHQQVEDLRAVLRWIHSETHQAVVVFGISIGGTISLKAAEQEPALVKSVVVISVDSKTSVSDAAVDAFLQDTGRQTQNRRLRRRIARLAKPPYTDPSAIQARASLLGDLDSLEYGRTFNALLRETLVAMLRAYGPVGTVRALRNINAVQRRLLPEVDSLDLFASPPTLQVPVHYIFGEQDALTPRRFVTDVPAAIPSPSRTVTLLPNAGHMVHFDQPERVRAITVQA